MVVSSLKLNYKLLVLLFVSSLLFILCTNFALLGTIRKLYGVFGHTFSVSILLTGFLYLNRLNKYTIIVLVLIYPLIFIPTVLISKGALLYAGVDYLETNRTLTEGNLASIIIAILLASLSASFNAIKSHKVKKIIYAFNATILLLLFFNALLTLTYTIHYGTPPLAVSLFGIVQTNLREAVEFIISRGSFVITVSIIAIISAPAVWCIFFKLQFISSLRINRSNIQNFSVSLTAAIILYNLYLYKPYSTYISVYYTVAAHSDFKESISSREEMVKKLDLDKSDINNGLFIVVIGESLTRDHMSLYDYDIDTTPWQKSMLSSNKFFKFLNSYSCHVSTSLSLSMALTSLSQYDLPKKTVSDCPSLVDIAKASGYEVSWISNQSKLGLDDSPQSIIASQANNQEFLNQLIYPSGIQSNDYDEVVLDTYRKILSGGATNKIVFVHLMGQHAAYEQRCPESFNVWEDNYYDNSVFYNDHILKKLYEIAFAQDDFQAMLYFSDHGEDIKIGHLVEQFSYTMARIPFWITVSDDFALKNADTIDAIKANIAKPFTNDLLFDIVCGLTNMTSHPFYRSGHDVTSKDFALKAEDVMIFNTHKVIDDPMFKSN